MPALLGVLKLEKKGVLFNYEEMEAAIEALGEIGPEAKEAVPRIVEIRDTKAFGGNARGLATRSKGGGQGAGEDTEVIPGERRSVSATCRVYTSRLRCDARLGIERSSSQTQEIRT